MVTMIATSTGDYWPVERRIDVRTAATTSATTIGRWT
jgi:hypothetical protein